MRFCEKSKVDFVVYRVKAKRIELLRSLQKLDAGARQDSGNAFGAGFA